MTWRREEIDLGMRFAQADGSGIFEVVGIADRPTVVLRSVLARGQATGGMDLHYVIESEEFAKWLKVHLEGPTS